MQLTGAPPFAFTWTRTPAGRTAPAETHRVEGWTEHTWALRTAQEGLFRVTAVQDRHCAVPRRFADPGAANVILGEA